MKKFSFVFMILLFSPGAFSFPGIEMFVGEYSYKSGPTDTVGCGNFKIELNSAGDGLNVYHIDSEGFDYLSYEFPFVNGGVQPWQYDWGDGIAKGDQNITFDGGRVEKLVRIKSFGFVVGTIYTSIYFTSYDTLTLEHKSSDQDSVCQVVKK